MMNSTRLRRRCRVSADGAGVVSHAGVGLLRETAEFTGLVDGVTHALADTYAGSWTHSPGQVFGDLAVVVADGADAIGGINVLGDRGDLFGSVASVPTAWRCVHRIDEAHRLPVLEARAAARAAAWAAGAGPDLSRELWIDIDATITIAHSEKENAAKTWKKTFGFHPLLAFLDRREVAGGEGLAGMLRTGSAGSNTAADHIEILDLALAALPPQARPEPEDPDSPRVLVRTDSAGASRKFAGHCRARGVRFSLGFDISDPIKLIVDDIDEDAWIPAIEADRTVRDGVWVSEVTDRAELAKSLSQWPKGSRLIIRRERPHPGAQLTFADSNGHRITAMLTDTPPEAEPTVIAELFSDQANGETNALAALELRHRGHARVEDRIREAKHTGLRNLPCHDFTANQAWLQIVLTAVDLVAWTQLIAFPDNAELARCEIATFRYRVLHVAARLTRSGRQTHLRIDKTWRWAVEIAEGFHRLRAAFT